MNFFKQEIIKIIIFNPKTKLTNYFLSDKFNNKMAKFTDLNSSTLKYHIRPDSENYSSTDKVNNKITKFTDLDSSTFKYHISKREIKTEKYDLNDIKIIGHRGTINSGLRENTIDSFMLAHRKNAQMVEMDIQMTKDEILVVFHNFDINGKKIKEMNYLEFLKESKSSEDNFKGTNTTLYNILNHLPDDLALYLEIKVDELLIDDSEYEIRMVEKIVEMLEEFPNKKIMFGSFSRLVCGILKIYCSEYKTCLIFGSAELNELDNELNQLDINCNNDVRFCKNVLEFVKNFNIDGLVFDTKVVPRIEYILNSRKDRPIYLMCYGEGTNQKEQINELKRRGILSFCTDLLDLHNNEDINNNSINNNDNNMNNNSINNNDNNNININIIRN